MENFACSIQCIKEIIDIFHNILIYRKSFMKTCQAKLKLIILHEFQYDMTRYQLNSIEKNIKRIN